jgi:hypothetical protein
MPADRSPSPGSAGGRGRGIGAFSRFPDDSFVDPIKALQLLTDPRYAILAGSWCEHQRLPGCAHLPVAGVMDHA